VAAARELGAREARLLEYTTSADVMRDAAADSAVGYAALVFCAPPQT
jgi:AmmeMemoRadiSam system protein B